MAVAGFIGEVLKESWRWDHRGILNDVLLRTKKGVENIRTNWRNQGKADYNRTMWVCWREVDVWNGEEHIVSMSEQSAPHPGWWSVDLPSEKLCDRIETNEVYISQKKWKGGMSGQYQGISRCSGRLALYCMPNQIQRCRRRSFNNSCHRLQEMETKLLQAGASLGFLLGSPKRWKLLILKVAALGAMIRQWYKSI